MHPKQTHLLCIITECDYKNLTWNADNTLKHIKWSHHDTITQDKIRQCYQPALPEPQITEMSAREEDIATEDEVPVLNSPDSDEEEIIDEQIDDIEGNLM